MVNVGLPKEDNIVLSAYDAVLKSSAAEDALDGEHLTKQYVHFFLPIAPATQGTRPVFERFSLTDPRIRIGISSTTTSV